MTQSAVIDRLDRSVEMLERRVGVLESVPSPSLEPTLENSWVAGSTGTAGVIMRIVGSSTLVNFIGSVKGDNNTAAFTLPTEMRPLLDKYFICANTNQSGASVDWRVTIASTGVVTIQRDSTTEEDCQLSNIMYFVNE